MSSLDLARWQFGITTVYHFLFVPLTIGLGFFVAGMQTAWYRTRKPEYLRTTRFFGKLFLINFAIGVVTGIVQEFQFGMNWSAYSRFVGDIFGAPLAMEGLIAFFLESTFLGLWIFGWDRLPKKVHLATIWAAATGTLISAFFILAANSWMQHPVGFHIDPAKHRAELTSIGAVLTNSTLWVTFPHTLFGAFVTTGVFVLAVAAWHLRRGNEVNLFRPVAKAALAITLVASVGVAVSGDLQARVMTKQQPMKMAAAEALYHGSDHASFSLFTVGSLNGNHEKWSIRVPGLLSFMATGSFNGKVDGIDDVQAQEIAKYGPGNYKPVIPIAYWSFRLMIGFGAIAALLSAFGLWLFRRRRLPQRATFYRIAILALATPYLANTLGWIFTEMGRQPWVVYGVMTTADAVSGVSTASVATSLIVYTLLYGALAVVMVRLMLAHVRKGPDPLPDIDLTSEAPEPMLSFSY
ncbi:MAG TPA: cytochrome ubiquinol oxidase subunit I [Mycobacteriales bacterium]|nr:cytochrome ubiquinol oxidase subunit I [Mycobacteriales bacterium]